jgi:hypothetical protein
MKSDALEGCTMHTTLLTMGGSPSGWAKPAFSSREPGSTTAGSISAYWTEVPAIVQVVARSWTAPLLHCYKWKEQGLDVQRVLCCTRRKAAAEFRFGNRHGIRLDVLTLESFAEARN